MDKELTPLLTARRRGRPPKVPPQDPPTVRMVNGHWTEEARQDILETADWLEAECRSDLAVAAELRLFVLKDRWKEADGRTEPCDPRPVP